VSCVGAFDSGLLPRTQVPDEGLALIAVRSLSLIAGPTEASAEGEVAPVTAPDVELLGPVEHARPRDRAGQGWPSGSSLTSPNETGDPILDNSLLVCYMESSS